MVDTQDLKSCDQQRSYEFDSRPGHKMKNMKKRIYLDDVRTPVDPEWIVVRNYNEFVAQIKLIGLDSIELISLDHDLGDTAMEEYYSNVRPNFTLDYNHIQEKTGLDCTRWLIAESMITNIPLPTVYVHSANPIGSANMMGYINNYYKNCRQPEVCVKVNIEHTIDSNLMMSLEERQAKWKKPR